MTALTTSWCDPDLVSWAGLEDLAELVDPATLATLSAHPVTADRIRIKPGLSAVLSWHTDTDHGWAAVLTDPDKIAPVRRRATHTGEPLLLDRTTGSAALLAGRLDSDPGVARELGHARRRLRVTGEWQVLAHNPGKRVVAAVGLTSARHVVRIAARPQDHLVEATRRWRAFGAPVLPVRTIGRRHTAVSSPWWGQGDLSQAGTTHHAELAGRSLAEIHRASVGAAVAHLPPLDLADLVGILPAERERIAWLSAEIQARTASGPVGLLHGDLSPDQILVSSTASGEAEIRIVDLDRATTGPAGADVGSWVAACDRAGRTDLADAFLAGWERVAGPMSATDLSAWQARAVLAAAVEPFRQLRSDWRTQITALLARAESLLTQEKR